MISIVLEKRKRKKKKKGKERQEKLGILKLLKSIDLLIVSSFYRTCIDNIECD